MHNLTNKGYIFRIGWASSDLTLKFLIGNVCGQTMGVWFIGPQKFPMEAIKKSLDFYK